MVIAVTNRKGGVGKTTTSLSLASGLFRRGYKIMTIDGDPQLANLTSYLNINTTDVPTLYEVLVGKAVINNKEIVGKEIFDLAVRHTSIGDFLPADSSLAAFENDSILAKETCLKWFIEKFNLDKTYDFIIIDTPPSLGYLTTNALAACDKVLVPSSAKRGSLRGVLDIMGLVSQIKERINPKIEIDGVLITEFNTRPGVGPTLLEWAHIQSEKYGFKLFGTVIRKNDDIDKAEMLGTDVFAFNHKAPAAIDYETFIDEFLVGIEKGRQ